MSDNFERAIPHILLHEGGYVNDPDDPGGETNYGICKRNYPTLDIKALTRESAINIYRADYWRKWMDDLPYPVAAKIFDMCVNMGHKQAIKLLQRAMGCDDDGVIGPITLAATKVYANADLVNRLVAQQREFYTGLAERKPSMKKFLRGWLTRANWTPSEV